MHMRVLGNINRMSRQDIEEGLKKILVGGEAKAWIWEQEYVIRRLDNPPSFYVVLRERVEVTRGSLSHVVKTLHEDYASPHHPRI